jgi:CRP-like cAMP-binding protein
MLTPPTNSLNAQKRRFEDRLQTIESYMREKKLPPALREKCRNYYYITNEGGKSFDEAAILGYLAPALRQEVVRYNRREMYEKVPFLTSSPYSFVSALCVNLNPEVSFPDEIIFNEGTSGIDLYFIEHGIVEIKSHLVLGNAFHAIGDGCYFGDVSVFLKCKRTATTKSQTTTYVHKINRDDIELTLKDYPEIREYLVMVATKRLRRVHAMDPKLVTKDPTLSKDADSVDAEDSKTELFVKHINFNGNSPQDIAHRTILLKHKNVKQISKERQNLERKSFTERRSQIIGPRTESYSVQ